MRFFFFSVGFEVEAENLDFSEKKFAVVRLPQDIGVVTAFGHHKHV